MTGPSYIPEPRSWAAEYLPHVLPSGWEVVHAQNDGAMYRRSGLKVVMSGHETAGRRWLHVSLSRTSHMPDYDDLKKCKDTFLNNFTAYQVFPKPSAHVNLHPYCLHLWAHVDGEDPLPDFRSDSPLGIKLI